MRNPQKSLPCAGDRPWSAWYGRPSCRACLCILVTPRKFLQARWDASPNPQSSGPLAHGSLHKTNDLLLILHGGAPSSVRGKLFTGDPAQGMPGLKYSCGLFIPDVPPWYHHRRLLLAYLTGSERRGKLRAWRPASCRRPVISADVVSCSHP